MVSLIVIVLSHLPSWRYRTTILPASVNLDCIAHGAEHYRPRFDSHVYLLVPPSHQSPKQVVCACFWLMCVLPQTNNWNMLHDTRSESFLRTVCTVKRSNPTRFMLSFALLVLGRTYLHTHTKTVFEFFFFFRTSRDFFLLSCHFLPPCSVVTVCSRAMPLLRVPKPARVLRRKATAAAAAAATTKGSSACSRNGRL